MSDATLQCALNRATLDDSPLQSKRNRAFSLRVLKTRDGGGENDDAPERMYCVALRRDDENSVDIAWWSKTSLCDWLHKHHIAQPSRLSLVTTP